METVRRVLGALPGAGQSPNGDSITGQPYLPRVPAVGAVNGLDGSGGSISGEQPEVVDDAVEEHAEQGVHAIVKRTNYWFERRVHALELRASEDAEAWARAGLPLQDVTRQEPLDVEVVLLNHARQLFRDWAERVRNKTQDAIARSSGALGEHVGELRRLIARLDDIAQDLSVREEKIERIRQESTRDAGPVQYNALISPWLFWPMAFLLVLVEFAANFPVFRLLLPMEGALATAARTAVENVDDASWYAGIELFLRSLSMHFEAFVVALVAVAALVLLGKQFGASLRPVLALRPREHPLATNSIRAQHRQHGAVAAMSAVGIAAVVVFLYIARGSIATTADARVEQDSVRRVALESRLSEARDRGDRPAIAALTQESVSLRDLEERHRDDAAYARTVESNNAAILLLNVGLVAVAMVLGFCFAADNLTDKRGEHPDLARLRDRCAELRQERIAMVADARAALARATAVEGAMRHLAQASPLSTWDSKVKRLSAIVPHFRAENSRLRGLDPANIRAFDMPCDLDLAPPEPQGGFAIPSEVERFVHERDELAQRLEHHKILSVNPNQKAAAA